MIRPRTILLAVGLAFVATIGFSLNAAEQGGKSAGVKTIAAADSTDATESNDTKALESNLHRLDLQFSEIALRLTELDLQKIEDMNRKVAGIYSDSEVDRFRSAVAVAKERVNAA